MQGTDRNIVVARMPDHTIARPIEQWIHFQYLMTIVDRRECG